MKTYQLILIIVLIVILYYFIFEYEQNFLNSFLYRKEHLETTPKPLEQKYLNNDVIEVIKDDKGYKINKVITKEINANIIELNNDIDNWSIYDNKLGSFIDYIINGREFIKSDEIIMFDKSSSSDKINDKTQIKNKYFLVSGKDLGDNKSGGKQNDTITYTISKHTHDTYWGSESRNQGNKSCIWGYNNIGPIISQSLTKPDFTKIPHWNVISYKLNDISSSLKNNRPIIFVDKIKPISIVKTDIVNSFIPKTFVDTYNSIFNKNSIIANNIKCNNIISLNNDSSSLLDKFKNINIYNFNNDNTNIPLLHKIINMIYPINSIKIFSSYTAVNKYIDNMKLINISWKLIDNIEPGFLSNKSYTTNHIINCVNNECNLSGSYNHSHQIYIGNDGNKKYASGGNSKKTNIGSQNTTSSNILYTISLPEHNIIYIVKRES